MYIKYSDSSSVLSQGLIQKVIVIEIEKVVHMIVLNVFLKVVGQILESGHPSCRAICYKIVFMPFAELIGLESSIY